MFDSLQVACYSGEACAVPAARDRAFAVSFSSAEGCLHMPVSALALFAQVAQPDAGSGDLSSSTDIVRLVLDSSWLSLGVLSILLLFSAISWGITLYKLAGYRPASRQTSTFLDVFRKSSKFSEVQAVCPSLKDSPLVGLFQAGYSELNSQLRQPPADPTKPAAAAGRPT